MKPQFYIVRSGYRPLKEDYNDFRLAMERANYEQIADKESLIIGSYYEVFNYGSGTTRDFSGKCLYTTKGKELKKEENKTNTLSMIKCKWANCESFIEENKTGFKFCEEHEKKSQGLKDCFSEVCDFCTEKVCDKGSKLLCEKHYTSIVTKNKEEKKIDVASALVSALLNN